MVRRHQTSGAQLRTWGIFEIPGSRSARPGMTLPANKKEARFPGPLFN
jgi:hypothetical protein